MNTLQNLTFQPQTIESADPVARPILEQAKKSMGMVPNMYAGMANNPALLDAYTHAYNSFRQHAGFTPQEQEVIFMSISYENGCEYCLAAHSFIADKMSKVPTEVTDAIRNNTEVPDAKLGALSRFSKAFIAKRGRPSESDVEEFLSAGYTERHVAGVVAAAGVKTMSNYYNHVFETPLDDAFASRAWKQQ
ncbi:putative peroxidase-related enzyme [Lewinella marina]|uniref:Alkylhydroperoxidase n=1 Tax=Neolewinella marina TaxID=438751 RepID=A0A2G0CEN3_9BACT|nr:carboxymuconolactone decarboxylase family protein [Neolewinella marina]NJB87299.1 putative peroxidase-related enzyme [Neolewinella marina]PHK98380.1 alkylhydroperoxidase [Neolewinella marina]